MWRLSVCLGELCKRIFCNRLTVRGTAEAKDGCLEEAAITSVFTMIANKKLHDVAYQNITRASCQNKFYFATAVV